MKCLIPNPSRETLAEAADLIEKSIKRSPCGTPLDVILVDILKGDARLWMNGKSAAVTNFIQSAIISKDEQIWHAAGSRDELLTLLKEGSEVCRVIGCDRMVLETDRAWSKWLKPHGFEEVTVLVKEL